MNIKLIKLTDKGFTLIEILVALAILAIGLLMAANLQTTAIWGNKGSSEMSFGSLLGQQVIEQLLTYNSATSQSLCATCSPNAPSGTHTAATEPTLPSNQTFNGVVYSWNYTVSTNTPISGVRTIMLNVNWTDTTSHQVSFVERMVP